MDKDIYKAPDSDVEVIQTPKGSSVKGIIYGALTDIIGTIIFSTLFGFLYAFILLRQGVSQEELVNSLSAMERWSLPSLIGIFIGTTISAIAGYVCAAKSIKHINRNAFILSIISASFGFLMGSASNGFSEFVFLTGLTVGAIFSGANYWRFKKNRL
jgi:hypothetical protein